MLRKILFLEAGELGRLLPFFTLYFFLFSSLSLADGVSLALVLHEVGAEYLPAAYGMVAVLNFLMIFLYVLLGERSDTVRVLRAIIFLMVVGFGAIWGAVANGGGEPWVMAMFVGREIFFTLILMHFGTVLQDYFTRAELNRILPIVYSAGRLGGIMGGVLLDQLVASWGLIHLTGLCVAFLVLALGTLSVADRISGRVAVTRADLGSENLTPPKHGNAEEIEKAARAALAGFLYYVWASPLLFWNTLSLFVFQMCRWTLNFQYSRFFGEYFGDEIATARFLGLYTQYALIASLILQLLVVNRLVAWLGIKGANWIYAILMLAAMVSMVLPMTLTLAVMARLVESELRFGLRNPINLMITNHFPKDLRVRVRAWTMGFLNPFATLAASLLLGVFLFAPFRPMLPWLSATLGFGYVLSCYPLHRSFRE